MLSKKLGLKKFKPKKKKKEKGNFLVVQCLGLCAFTAEGLGLIPGWGTKVPQPMWHRQKTPKTCTMKKAP